MRRLIPFLFGILFLLRIQSDGTIIDQTTGRNTRYANLSQWQAKQGAVGGGWTVTHLHLSADGRTVLILLDPPRQ